VQVAKRTVLRHGLQDVCVRVIPATGAQKTPKLPVR
jgi:hypothetical protein